MTRHAPRRPNVSRPLLAALLLAIGLVALAYLHDADKPAPDAQPAPPKSTGAKNAAAAKTAAAPTAAPGKGDGAPHDPASIAPGAVAASDSAAAAGSTAAHGAEPQASQQPTATLAATPSAPVDIFPSQRWDPPPPPPPDPAAIAAPAAPPQPPALPFTVRSLWLDADGTFYVVLNASGREFPVCVGCKRRGFLRKGDVLMETYRIEEINRRELRLQFLPLKRQQKLSLGGAK